jgi:hypothetical protein
MRPVRGVVRRPLLEHVHTLLAAVHGRPVAAVHCPAARMRRPPRMRTRAAVHTVPVVYAGMTLALVLQVEVTAAVVLPLVQQAALVQGPALVERPALVLQLVVTPLVRQVALVLQMPLLRGMPLVLQVVMPTMCTVAVMRRLPPMMHTVPMVLALECTADLRPGR